MTFGEDNQAAEPSAPATNAVFSVIIVTAAPAGMAAEAGGAFVKIDGREILLRAVELFLNRDNVKQIQVVFNNDFLEEGKRKYGGHFGFSGVKVLGGGPRWIDQLAAAASGIKDEATHVLVHDAARPAVSYLDLESIMATADKHAIASLVTPSRSVLVEVDEGGNALAYRKPEEFMNLVTPQVFKKERFLEMTKSRTEPHPSEVTLIKGSPLNVRVGGGGDASMIKAMLNMLPKPKIKAPSSPFEEAQW
jgi:2-C-methyl-D-erythritol 4-phosphate cytidylyltransferase